MKYAIRHNGSYWYDGANAVHQYETAGWVAENPTVYETREAAERVVRHWFNNNDHPDYVDGIQKDGVTPRPRTRFRFCTIGGNGVGEYHYDVQDKKMVLVKSEGPFPGVVEVEDDFGRPGWMGF